MCYSQVTTCILGEIFEGKTNYNFLDRLADIGFVSLKQLLDFYWIKVKERKNVHK